MIDWTLTWNMVLAIATALMTLAIIIAGYFAYRQLRQIKGANNSSLMMQLHQTWDSREYIQSRQMINQYNKDSTLTESLKSFYENDADEFFTMARIANFFENLGYLTCEGYLERKHALELFGTLAKRYWHLFSGFVTLLRKHPKEPQPDAWVYFQHLAEGCPQRNRCLGHFKTPILNAYEKVSRKANQ